MTAYDSELWEWVEAEFQAMLIELEPEIRAAQALLDAVETDFDFENFKHYTLKGNRSK